MKIRIGYEDPDTLITYPRAHNLSACAQPIRVRGWVVPGRVRLAVEVPFRVAARCPAGLSDAPCTCKLCPHANAGDSAAQEISVDWWCTMIRRDSPEVAGAHTLDSSEAPPSHRTR